MSGFKEHTVVKTRRDIQEGDTVVPVGHVGTVVGVHPTGYDVEFLLHYGNQEAEIVVIYCPEGSIVSTE